MTTISNRAATKQTINSHQTHLPTFAETELASRSYFQRYFLSASSQRFASWCCADKSAILRSARSIAHVLQRQLAGATLEFIVVANLAYACVMSLPFQAERSHLCRMSFLMRSMLSSTG